jgi:hypothetical protein
MSTGLREQWQNNLGEHFNEQAAEDWTNYRTERENSQTRK